MGSRRLKILIALLTGVLATAVILLCFPGLFTLGEPDPFDFPSPSHAPNDTSSPLSPPPASSFAPMPTLEPVTVTTDNVQKLLATLPRVREYGGLWTITRYWEQNDQTLSRAITCRVWEQNGYIRIETAEIGQPVQYLLQGTHRVFKWSENNQNLIISYAIGQISAEQNTQIPPVDPLLSLSGEEITSADFVYLNEIPCVYVAVSQPDSPYEDQYWISWETRLLTQYERRKEGVLHLQATLTQVNRERPADDLFILPNRKTLAELDTEFSAASG